jgi:hypothetical protein
MKIIGAVCFLLLLGAPTLRADNFGDVFPEDATRLSFDVTAWCKVGGHRFVFEKTSLAEVMRALGGGKMEREPSDPGAAVWDYYIDYTDGAHLIRLSSNSDMGGEEHALQGVEIRDLSAKDRRQKLLHIALPIQFPFGSSSMTFGELVEKLGAATEHHEVYAYTYSTKYTVHDGNDRSRVVDAYSYLELRVRRGQVVDMEADHTSESE